MFGGFGQTQAAPAFGAAPATGGFGTSFGAFGQQQPQQPAFGAASAPAFGAASAPAFGAASTPAFGASPAPAFGAASSSAFGTTSAFGARPATAGFGGFGTTSTFGAASQPSAFGGLSTPAFGQPQTQAAFGAASTPAFGFGAASTPAFGASPASSPFGGTTAFGAQPASQPALGGGLFGTAASTPAASPFGAASQPAGGLFGAAPAFGAATPAAGAQGGTRAVPYTKTVERDGAASSTGVASTANYMSITMMPAYNTKSFEELRFEDYQAGVKSAAAGPAQPAAGTPGFGSPAANPFTGALGAATPGTFGSPAAGSPFGTPASTTPAFGGSLFGAQSAAATGFGAASAGAFGTTPANPFGAASAGAFGTPSTTPAFGSAFGATSASAFGSSILGASRPASGSSFAFNTTPSLFGTGGTSAFGAASAPSQFGQTASTSIFGSTPAASPGLFGTPQSAAASPFGTAGAFGSKPATTAFGTTPSLFPGTTTGAFGQTTPSMFGQQTGAGLFGGGMFGSTPATGSSLFAPTSTPALGMFGQTAGSSLFGTASTFAPGTAGQLGAMQLFQSTPALGAGTVGATAAAAPLNVAVAPYGAFPNLPAVPEPKVGISARPIRTTSVVGAGSLRASPLVSLRATASGAGNKLGASVMSRPTSVSPLGSLGVTASDAGIASAGSTPVSGTPGTLRARPNPHQLFIREPPPGTQPASTPNAFSPARTPAGNTQGGAQTPADGTPYNPFTPISSHRDQQSTPYNDGKGTASASHRDRNGLHDGPIRNGHSDGPVSKPQSSRATANHDFLPQLGKLAEQGYRYEPSSTQLTAMHDSNPQSLSQVSNFTVIRDGVGQIRWLQPVDVRGVKLDEIVTIKQGEVYCYEKGNSPPVGQGLNCDAEITLLNIYKKDPKTGAEVREGPAVIKWEKSLRAMCAKMGAKFLSYKPATGAWRFEVEHFSRYGLLPDVEEDNEIEPADDDQDADNEAGYSQGPSKKVARGLSFGLFPAVTEQDQGFEQDGSPVASDELADAGVMDEDDEQADYAVKDYGDDYDIDQGTEDGIEPDIQHTLPAHLALRPAQLMAMRDAFFAPGRPQDDQLQLVTSTAFPPAPDSAAVQDGNRTSGTRRWHCWGHPAPPMKTSRSTIPAPASNQTPTSALAIVPAAGSSQGAGQTAALPAPGDKETALAVVATSAEQVQGKQDLFHSDAGLSLGLSFRVGWGPDGKLVIPAGPGVAGVRGQPVIVSRVCVEGSGDSYGAAQPFSNPSISKSQRLTAAPTDAPPRLLALRARLRSMLQVHAKHSSPVASSITEEDDTRIPQWRLVCNSRGLPALISELISAAESQPVEEAGPVDDEDWDIEKRHEVETWKLLQVLYEEPPVTLEISANQGSGNDQQMADENGQQPAHLLATFYRQSGFSRWLQRQVMPAVRAAVKSASSPCTAVLQLLSAHHLAAAAAVSSSTGDVRLSTLLASAGLHAAAQSQVSKQLEMWSSAQMDSKIAKDRLLVYKLLAGKVLDVLQELSLDWKRALGLILWYQAGADYAPRNASGHTPAVILKYHELLRTYSRVPRPVPTYQLEADLPTRQVPNDAEDIQYQLMLVWAAEQQTFAQMAKQVEHHQYVMSNEDTMHTPGATPSGEAFQESPGSIRTFLVPSASLQQPVVSQLMNAGNHSSNPCSTALPWCTLSVLQALGAVARVEDAALKAAGDNSEVAQACDIATRNHMALISQLLLVGDVPEFAIYVALHLPDGPDGQCRNRVVRDLLLQTAQQWVDDNWKESFLTEVLKIPQPVLAAAKATWFTAEGNLQQACAAHIDALQWSSAHKLLVAHVAPTLMSEGRYSALQELLLPLQQNNHACPDWQHGGNIYLQFLQLVQSRPASNPAPAADLQRLAADIAEAKAVHSQGLVSSRNVSTNQPTDATMPSNLLPAPESTADADAQTQSAIEGAAVQVDNRLSQLAALDAMGRKVQAALVPALATQVMEGGGNLDMPALLSACGMQPAARGMALGAAAAHIMTSTA